MLYTKQRLGLGGIETHLFTDIGEIGDIEDRKGHFRRKRRVHLREV